MSKTTIKPCPFCGSAARVETTDYGDNPTKYYSIECLNDSCFASIEFGGTEEETIAAWNRRTGDQT